MPNIHIVVNKRPHEAPRTPMTGREIKELAGAPVENLLVEIVGSADAAAGGDDRIIGDEQSIELKNGMRFRTVNPATFG